MNALKELLKNPSTTVVDVRSPWEYESGHIPGALNIPVETVAQELPAFRAFKGPIVLYCRSGNRSGMATTLLKQHGLTNVHNGGSYDDMQSFLR
ncbi:MAG: hypothetical protein RJA57_1804 [Bacteroidota bacterium]|jgi:phage shock protein E